MKNELKNENILLAIVVGLLVCIYLFFYPVMPGIEDEIGFINQAIAFKKGLLFQTIGEYLSHPFADFRFSVDRFIPIRNPGLSLILSPVMDTAWQSSMFFIVLLTHLLGGLFLIKILDHLKLNRVYSIFYFLHPTLTLYSRTITADEFAGVLILMSFYFLLRKKSLSAGIFAGLAAVARYHAAIFLILMVLFKFFELIRKKESRDDEINSFLKLSLGGGAIGILLVAYNFHVFGGPVGISADRGTFGIQYLLVNLKYYIPALMILWPGMLISSLYISDEKLRTILSTVLMTFLIFFSFYYFYDKRQTFYETIVVGQRLIRVALPLFILSFCFMLDYFVKRFNLMKIWVFSAISVALLLGNTLIFKKHQYHLRKLHRYAVEVKKVIPQGSYLIANPSLYKLVGVNPPEEILYRHLPFEFVMSEKMPMDIDGELYFATFNKDGAMDFSFLIKNLSKKFILSKLEVSNEKMAVFRLTRRQ